MMTNLPKIAIAASIFAGAVCGISPASFSADIYADPLAQGSADGSSWADAFTSIQEAADELEPGDTLYSRGEFYESALTWGLSDFTWIGNSDPVRPTFIRGDRYFDDWEQQGDVVVADCDFSPVSVVYDYRQDHDGAVTGVPGAYFGHLPRASSSLECEQTDGSWYYNAVTDQLLVNAPGENPDPALIGACVSGNGVTIAQAENVVVRGVNTMLWCRFIGASGYGLRANGLTDSIFEDALLIDSGYHAAGFVGTDSARNVMRNLVARGQATNEIQNSIAFVFYSQTDRPDSECVGESLIFHAHPFFRHDGKPLVTSFRPMLGLSHTDGTVELGGIDWIGVSQVDYEDTIATASGVEMSWNAAFIGAGDAPEPTDPLSFDSYSVRVIDSTARTPNIAVSRSIAYDRTRFLHEGGDFGATQTATWFQDDSAAYLRSCNIVFAPGTSANTRLFRLGDSAHLTLEACTVAVVTDSNAGINAGTVFRLDSPNARLAARHCIFHRTTPGTFFANSSAVTVIHAESVLDFSPNLFHGFSESRYWIGSPGGTYEWWTTVIAPIEHGNVYSDPLIESNAFGEAVPAVGSVAYSSRWNSPALPAFQTLSGHSFSNAFGSHQPRPADTDGDDRIALPDLNAILAAFGSTFLPADGIAGDTDGDGEVDLADLNAVLAAFGTGYP